MAMTYISEAEPQFSQPVRQIVSMLAVILLVSAGGYLIYPALAPVFLASKFLNGLILFVFIAGLLATFWQVVQLIYSVNWIEGFVMDAPGQSEALAPRLLAPLAALLRSRGKRMQISATSSRSILDSVATRIDEARDITRYLVNLLIFLGLLGTFYGLATTIPAVVETIRSLAPQDGESQSVVFGRLMVGLESQLGGMGTAFSSSLLGLAGSLVVGLLELFASHGQNRFYRELEEWLSSITRLGFAGSGDGDGGGDIGNAAGIVDYMGQQVEAMHKMFAQADQGRVAMDAKLGMVADALTRLTDKLEQETTGTADALERIAAGQERLTDLIASRPDYAGPTDGADDPESRMHLRSIDVHLLRLLEEISAGRQETVTELRNELGLVAREIRRSRNTQRSTGQET